MITTNSANKIMNIWSASFASVIKLITKKIVFFIFAKVKVKDGYQYLQDSKDGNVPFISSIASG
ncbi:MAG: hypothetical protein LBG52_05605 [Candidatus Peribacteria bacterium]|nr:hypothetical protein [Candidatus Peribacteria bacterium]